MLIVVYRLSQRGDWFASIGEHQDPSPLSIHLGYSAVDFALSHELGHRFFYGIDFLGAGVDAESYADQVGFALYSSAWGWRDDILEDAPFGQIAVILLGPIWFFFTAGLMLQMKKALRRRYEGLGLPLDDFHEPTADRHLDAIIARWEKQKSAQEGYLSFIVDRGVAMSEDDAGKLIQLVERFEEFRVLCLRWIDEIPDADIQFAAGLR